ncbi:MAG: ATP-dependent helicase [Patescibacteria group bacterium]
MNLLDGLNNAQREAVVSTAPVLLCLAGAGSGKTTVLTRRVAYLHLTQRIGTSNMLALTFTRLAGKEMKERIMRLVGAAEGKKLFCNTFHAFAVKVLREWGTRIGIEPNFSIYGPEDREAIMAGIIAEFGGRTTLKKVLERFEHCQDVAEERDRYPEECKVLEEYGYRLRQNNAVDLDRLIDLVNKLWTQHPDVLQHYKRTYTHVFVDEFQDTNDEQMRLLELLHPEHIFFVGDDYQAIYGWRGARVEFIIELPAYRPDCHVVKLEDNYRSTHPIVAAANAVIAHNERQTRKTLRAHRDGRAVTVQVFPGVAEEAAEIIANVRDLHAACAVVYRDIAVLARTNAQLEKLKYYMDAVRIPAVLVSGNDDPFTKPDIRGLVAWMDIMVNKRDSINLQRALSFPEQFIPYLAFQQIKLGALRREIPILDAVFDSPLALKFREVAGRIGERLKAGATGAASEVFGVLVDELGIRKDYEEKGLTNRMQDANRAYAAMCRWEDSKRALGEDYSAGAFLKWLRYKDVQEKLIQDQQDAVRLMTVHAAKGLEFPAVFVAGMVDGVFPSKRSADLEEERRLFYVALTRAKDYLSVTCSTSLEDRTGNVIPAQPSRFLAEMSEEGGPDLE